MYAILMAHSLYRDTREEGLKWLMAIDYKFDITMSCVYTVH